MRPSAAEALKAAIRRALPLTLALIVLGAVAFNAFEQLRGARYSATARVFHQTTDLGAILTDSQPPFVDPERVINTALTLARSDEVYVRAARELGTGETSASLREVTAVTGDQDTDVISFTATMDTADGAIEAADAVASAYVAWRREMAGSTIRQSIEQLREELSRSDTNQAALRELLNRLRVLETLNSGGAILVERPSEATKVSPKPVQDTLLGASFGFVLALLISGLREVFNTRVRSEADVEDSLKRPVLATIQTLPKRSALVTVGRHESRYGDTYALLAANLMQIKGGEGPTVLAVTSAIAAEGKTTTASNLAVAMAQRGQCVVLADFDLRKPSVARMFRIPADSPGIVQLVDGTVELPEATWSVPVNGTAAETPLPTPSLLSENGRLLEPAVGDGGRAGWLRVVPSGGAERGARIARSPRTAAVLTTLAKDADVLILDTPPALATVEMAELSRIVDLVLVVVRHGRVTRRSLLSLNRQAEGWRSDIVGAVLVDAPAEEDDYYYSKS